MIRKAMFFALGSVIALNASVAGAETSPSGQTETVTVWQVDMSGRPPYTRERVEVPVVDAARLEIDDSAPETVGVWTIDRSGKPPYRRRFEQLPVTDIAAMTVEEGAEETVRFSGRPPFKRHR